MQPFAPTETILTLVPQYGAPLLALAAAAGAAGLPLPLTPLLLAAGALTGEGGLSFPVALLAAWLGAVVGDCAGFLVGRAVGRPLLRRAGPRVGLSPARLGQAEQVFRRYGGAAVWLTRWLLTPAAAAVNLLAGGHGYPFARFLVLGACGELLWAAGALALGRLTGGVGAAGPAERLAPAALTVAVLLLAGAAARRRLRRPPASG
jgi:membrane-associated protein